MKILNTFLLTAYLMFYLIKCTKIMPFTIKNTQITNCTIKLVSSQKIQNLIIIYSKSSTNFLKSIIQNIYQPYTLLNYNLNMDKIIKNKYEFHVIVINKLEDLKFILKKLYHTIFWNPRAKYLIISLGENKIEEILEETWHNYFLTNLIVLQDRFIYSYFPYNSTNCGEEITPTLLDNCQFNGQLFPNKIPKNLHKCPLKIVANQYPPLVLNPFEKSDKKGGCEISLINNIAKYLNMTKNITGIPDGFGGKKFPNGTYTGILQYVADNRFDIAIGQLFPNVSYFVDIDVSFFYHYIEFTWVVPIALPGKQWSCIVLIFGPQLWLAIFLSWLSFILICWIRLRNLSDALIVSWSILFQISIEQPKNIILRLVYISWVILTLIIAVLYQSQLVSILKTPIYEHQIQNSNELLSSNLKIIAVPDYWTRLAHSNKLTDQTLAQKAIILSQEEHAKYRQTYQKNIAFMINRGTFNYLLPKNYSFPSGEPAMYQFKETKFGNPISMFTKKGFVLLERVDEVVVKCVESGLFAKWMKDEEKQYGKMEVNNKTKAISLDHLTGAFLVLMLGLSWAFVVFGLEILIGRVYYKY